MEKTQKWFLIIVALLIFTASISPIGFFSHVFSVFTTFSTPSGDTLLTKVTPDGTVEWQAMLKGLTYSRVLKNPEGEYILYGSAEFPGSVLPSLMVTKIQQNGNISWSVIKSPDAYYPDIFFLEPAEYVFPDNTGYTVIDGRGTVIRLDDRGNEQWHRHYDSHLSKAIPMSDGGYALSGAFNYQEPHTDYSSQRIGWVIRLDSKGNRNWEYQAHEYRECNSLTELANGTLLAACEGLQTKELVALNEKGNVTGITSTGPETSQTTSSTDSMVFYNATKMQGGKEHISILYSRKPQNEIIIEDSLNHKEIKETYRILSTEDNGFLVFSAVPM